MAALPMDEELKILLSYYKDRIKDLEAAISKHRDQNDHINEIDLNLYKMIEDDKL